jgi:hypothetical protein
MAALFLAFEFSVLPLDFHDNDFGKALRHRQRSSRAILYDELSWISAGFSNLARPFFQTASN